jgi:cytochrome P450
MTINTFDDEEIGVAAAASGNPDRPYDEMNLSTRAFWTATADERERSFAALRKDRPITWQPPFEDALIDEPNDHGYWAITTHRHLIEVTRRPDDFLSSPSILMENLPPAVIESAQSIIAMDPPRHSGLRRLVAAAFTPRQMRRIEDQIQANAAMVVDNLIAKAKESPDGWVDFVSECGAVLPMHNINDMMAVPDGDRQEAAEAVMRATSWNDPEIAGVTKDDVLATLFDNIFYMHELAGRLIEERRDNPGPDLFSGLIAAEVDGERLTDHEIGSFFVLLTIAGIDTTRQSLAHGLRALTTHPDQRAWLMEDLAGRMPTATEEFVRWATPIMTFRRTAARDCELDGAQITEGDKVVMFYSSANRDETAIDRPHDLDLSRHPNPHVGFGGGGIHHCLGNQLARFQIRALFVELLTRCPDIVAGDPVFTPGNFFHVVKRMPCLPLPR